MNKKSITQCNTKPIENAVDMIIVGFIGYTVFMISAGLSMKFNPDWLFMPLLLGVIGVTLFILSFGKMIGKSTTYIFIIDDEFGSNEQLMHSIVLK